MMNYDERNESSSAYQRFRGSMNVGMGVIYLILGSVAIYMRYFGAIELDPTIAYILGTMMILYGIFRLWRGLSSMLKRNRN